MWKGGFGRRSNVRGNCTKRRKCRRKRCTGRYKISSMVIAVAIATVIRIGIIRCNGVILRKIIPILICNNRNNVIRSNTIDHINEFPTNAIPTNAVPTNKAHNNILVIQTIVIKILLSITATPCPKTTVVSISFQTSNSLHRTTAVIRISQINLISGIHVEKIGIAIHRSIIMTVVLHFTRISTM